MAKQIGLTVFDDGTTRAVYDTDEIIVDAPADDAPPPPDYSSLPKAKLEEEVALRNSERDPEDADYIVVDAPGNKAELVAALVADDQVED